MLNMSVYFLTVIKKEKNEFFDEEMQKFKQLGMYGNQYGLEPQPFFEVNHLNVVVTEEQYQKIIKGVLETFS